MRWNMQHKKNLEIFYEFIQLMPRMSVSDTLADQELNQISRNLQAAPPICAPLQCEGLPKSLKGILADCEVVETRAVDSIDRY